MTDAWVSFSLGANMNGLSRFSPVVYCVMRLIVGLLFACHGGQKILGFPPVQKVMQLDTLGTIGGWIELVCGFLIAFGLLTRVAALIASGEMAVAYLMVHAPGGLFTGKFAQPVNGEPAVIYCFIFLFIFFYGPGRYALDLLLFRRGVAAEVTQ